MPRGTSTAPRDLRFVVIGAGMAGILSAIKLREHGYDDFVIYEKGDSIGGTWRENVYPGIACDVPSHLYSYSFALNPDWSQRFSAGPEIRAYFESVAKRHGVDERIRFGQEITRCTWRDGRWHLTSRDGTTDEADVVIAATGVLHHPSIPRFEGADEFEGAMFHSARWDPDLHVEGRRVGVVGTGSSAIQIVSALAGRVGQLTVFQRTPQWIISITNESYSDSEKAAFRRDPQGMLDIREQVARAFIDGFANALVDAEAPQLQAIHDACVANLENAVRDPELREKLRPEYRAACKRLIMSEDFYEAIQQPHVALVTEGIERLERSGVRTRDGVLHELDALVLATGFRVDRFMRPIEVTGRDGVRLDDVWSRSPSAYLSITIPDFPNLFMLNGPNGPVGNFSLIDVAELQFDYVLQLVELLRARRCREVSASHEALTRFDADRIEAARTTIWYSGCKSWYLDANGIPMAWPWTFDRFREEMAAPKLDCYELR